MDIPQSTARPGGAERVARGAVLVFLLLASVGLIVAPAIIASRVRASLARAEERLFMQSWMLKHLVPDQARSAASVRPGPPSTSA